MIKTPTTILSDHKHNTHPKADLSGNHKQHTVPFSLRQTSHTSCMPQHSEAGGCWRGRAQREGEVCDHNTSPSVHSSMIIQTGFSVMTPMSFTI